MSGWGKHVGEFIDCFFLLNALHSWRGRGILRKENVAVGTEKRDWNHLHERERKGDGKRGRRMRPEGTLPSRALLTRAVTSGIPASSPSPWRRSLLRVVEGCSCWCRSLLLSFYSSLKCSILSTSPSPSRARCCLSRWRLCWSFNIPLSFLFSPFWYMRDVCLCKADCDGQRAAAGQ